VCAEAVVGIFVVDATIIAIRKGNTRRRTTRYAMCDRMRELVCDGMCDRKYDSMFDGMSYHIECSVR